MKAPGPAPAPHFSHNPQPCGGGPQLLGLQGLGPRSTAPASCRRQWLLQRSGAQFHLLAAHCGLEGRGGCLVLQERQSCAGSCLLL